METSDGRSQDEQVTAVFGSARSLDPVIEVEAIRRFLREVAEMDDVLPTLAVENAPLVTGFTADWPDEGSS